MAVLRAVYKGSRSIRGGTWPLGLDGLTAVTTVVLMVLGGSMGVVEMGRLKAVGSMSPGIARANKSRTHEIVMPDQPSDCRDRSW